MIMGRRRSLTQETSDRASLWWAPRLRYPNEHVWFVFVSSMDLMLTWLILNLGGRELNPLANWIHHSAGFNGTIGFKFAIVVLVVSICEKVGRRHLRTGRYLARFAVAISAVPMVWSMTQLVLFSAGGGRSGLG